jgi:hypothetical protein
MDSTALNEPAAGVAEEIRREVERVAPERLPDLLCLVRRFREESELPPPVERFRRGWRQAMSGETWPLSTLWEDAEEDDRAA